MKILLLGEYSAIHKNLREGLISLGHEVNLASNGDGWKNIPRDIDINYNNKIIPYKIASRIYPWIDVKNFFGYDIVQLMSPDTIFKKYFPRSYYFNLLKKNNKKIFLLASGGDAFYWKYGRDKLEYGPFEDILKYDLKGNPHPSQDPKYFKFNQIIADSVNGIIPLAYEYELSYKHHQNLRRIIPFPMNTETIKYKENNIYNKIVIFHGMNRYGVKGTKYIKDAFNILKNKYPNNLELILNDRMPLEEYLKVLDKANVVIDQTSSYSVGLNGLYALAKGKVVLGGAEPEAQKSLGVNTSPVINIKPSSESIVNEIEKLLKNKNKIKELGYLSRKYVENVHSHIGVSKKFLDTWAENVNKINNF